jgi:hypothetical protein
MSSLQLNKFNIWLVEVKQSYISISSGHLNPSSAAYHTENTHSSLFCIFAFWLELDKSSKHPRNLWSFPHLDSILSSFPPSKSCWKFLFSTVPFKLSSMAELDWRKWSTLEISHLHHSPLGVQIIICSSLPWPNSSCILNFFKTK